LLTKFTPPLFRGFISSLQYLKKLSINQLKIDPSFFRDLISDVSDWAIVRTIITMAHSLDLNVIAEGVETQKQKRYLLDNGCTGYQGYSFSKPLPINEFEALLKKGWLVVNRLLKWRKCSFVIA
jgi:EAL domain-containing protein (putative c-di-GMP-specific phosphodiesterase class I)